jgi:hypothetical protein
MAARLPKELARFAVQRGGTTMFSSRSALEVLDWFEARGARILGVDGFYLSDTSTRPSLEDSIGLSDSAGGIAEARRHIELRSDSPLFFEIVTDLDYQLMGR